MWVSKNSTPSGVDPPSCGGPELFKSGVTVAAAEGGGAARLAAPTAASRQSTKCGSMARTECTGVGTPFAWGNGAARGRIELIWLKLGGMRNCFWMVIREWVILAGGFARLARLASPLG